MATIHKFMFETSFDNEPQVAAHVEEESDAEAEEIEREPVFSADDVAEAREQGLQAGREEGTREAIGGIEANIAQMLDRIVTELPSLFEAHEQAVSRAHADAIAVAGAVAAKLFPALNAKHGFDEVAAVVEQALSKLADEPRVAIRVAPEMAEPIRSRIGEAVQRLGVRGDVVVDGDEEIAFGDCRLIWSDGSSERDTERLRTEIDEIVARHAGASGTQAPEGGVEVEPGPEPAAPDEATEPAAGAGVEEQAADDVEPVPSAEPTDHEPAEPKPDASEAEPPAPDDEELP